MFAQRFPTALPRRVTAYFLLFGLAAIVWLGAGVFYVSTAITESRSVERMLAVMGKSSHRLVLKHLESEQPGLQEEVERLCRENMLAYCAIVSPRGEYLAHSSPDRVGETPDEPAGQVETWGEVERVQFSGEHDGAVVEYRVPLRVAQHAIGTLRMGVVEPSRLTAALRAAHYGPLAVLGPLLCMGLGAVVLRRLVRPVAEVERQLRKIAVAPSIVDLPLEEVEVHGAAALGWNRLVEHRGAVTAGSGLHERLSQSLEGVRQKRLAGILNSLSEGVLTTDREGVITYHNTSAVALIERRQRPRIPEPGDRLPAGAPPARGAARPEASASLPAPAGEKPPSCQDVSLIGESLLTWLGRRWLVPSDSPFSDPGSLHRTILVELERIGDDQRRVLRVTRSPCHATEANERDGHVWTLRDVTQQKLAEEMRTQFVDTATHELRTPLANIKAYAETLALEDLPDVEQQKEFLNTINSEATRLARFVDDLLSVSSMEIGSLSLARQPTDLERLLGNVVGKVKPQTKEKDITFETQFPEKWPEPELDKDKIAATLVNLLGNAVKYTPRGGRVALRVKAADGQLEISIEDTGIGISQEDIPKLFDKFFRSNDPRVHAETGTGLGLSLAYEVIRLHGGKIIVDSELNKGSTFLVTLPLG